LKHVAKKRFGQHFLVDAGVIDAIVQAVNPKPGQRMVEIGPGQAALTQPLVERLGHLTVIELDRDLAAELRKQKNLFVIENDILKVDLSHVIDEKSATEFESNLNFESSKYYIKYNHDGKLRMVGNLPYNISSPILFHLLDFVDLIEDQHFMLQKEVVERMVAKPATSAYGRLSVMLQWRYAMENVLFVPPESFEPPPRVDSAVVRMVPRADAAPLEVKRLSEIVRVAFSQRRKLLRHSLGKWLEAENYAGDFNVTRRAEEVPVSEYIALAQRV
jgi:16S rRNA (adenine1518-N6/adenine1519-N6)-dimethyltransferase